MTHRHLDTLLGSFAGDHALAIFERHDLAHEAERRNARPRERRPPERELAELVGLAEQLRAEASMRQGPRREAARKVARFVARHSRAQVDDDATIDFQGNIVVSGHPREMEKVAAWIERLARDSGRSVSAVVETFDDPDDPDWAVCRIRGLEGDG